jgi:3-hydroxy-9,10-secoandrosta-1,3,5(10)-triene-9,17-dione monooxygenase reductase component
VTNVTPERFRLVLGHLPTGVTVLTASGPDGPTGMAANSVTSVSLEPPLILVCPAKTSSTWRDIRAARRFCVNVLARDHEALCRQFAKKGADRFAGVRYHKRMVVPSLDEAVAWLDCEISHEHDAGDHTIVVARVAAVDAAEAGTPLVFFRGSYGTFDLLPAPSIYYGEGQW